MAKEYIEREALLARLKPAEEDDDRCAVLMGDVRKILRDFAMSAPAADVVEVVRCKDCVHMTEHFGARFCEVWAMFNGEGDDGFCNYGERKDDADN